MNVSYLTALRCGVHRGPCFQRGWVTLQQLNRQWSHNICPVLIRTDAPKVLKLKVWSSVAHRRLSSQRNRKHRSFLAKESSNEICHGTSQIQALSGNTQTHFRYCLSKYDDCSAYSRQEVKNLQHKSLICQNESLSIIFTIVKGWSIFNLLPIVLV